MRILCTSDWELTRERLPIAEIVLKDLMSYRRETDVFVFDGDMFREYNAVTESFAHKILGSGPGIFVVGNHDREVGADRLSSAFPDAGVFSTPQVFEMHGVWFGILPAPDRAAFGASRGIEGKRARDEALSAALEAALIALETQIGPENLGRAILFFHGAVDGAEVGCGQLASGLTWTIPGARLARWALAIGGHIHRPGKISENVYSVGGIANWTFSDRAEQFRALVIDTEPDFSDGQTIINGFGVSDIPLLRALVPIELEANDGDFDFETTAVLATLEERGVNPNTDTVSLKIKARLPQHEMTIVPTGEKLMEALNDLVERKLIQNCIITREVTGLHKARLTTEQSARDMSLAEMLDLYVETTGNGTSPETVVAAKDRIERIGEYYRPGGGNFGFKPLEIKIVNFRQWGAATLDFQSLEGAVALTGAMASGKSNLLEAIMVALYKRSPSSTGSIEDELRLGATSGSIELTFEARGKQYLVRRAFERGKGGVSCKSELFELEIDTTASAVCEAANDIDKRIVEMLGSYEFTLSTIFRAQRDIDRLIEATPAQWHKLMLEALALERFEPLRKAAANQADTSALRGTQEETVLEELDSQLANVTAEAVAENAAALSEDVDRLKATISEADRQKDALDGERQALIDTRARLRAAANERANLETSIREAKRALAGVTVEDIGARPAVPTVDIAVLESEAAGLKASREKLLDADAAKRKELAKAEGEVAVHEDAAKRIGRELEMLGRQIEAYEATQGELKGPPCRQALHVVGTPMEENCPAWLYYSKADVGTELEEKLENARARETAEIHYAGTASAKALGVKGELTPIAADLAAIAPTMRLLETKIGDYRNALHAAALWDEKAKGRKAACDQAAARAKELDDLQAKLSALADNGAEISETLLAIERIENRIGAQDGIIKAARAAMREADARLVRLEEARKRVTEIEASIAEHKRTAGKHVSDRIAWELIANAFHHTGIPYLLMERVMGGFEKIANEILDTTGLTVQIETVTPTKKGEARDRLTVRFTDERGQHWLSQASGGQSTTVSMALSAALAIVGSQFWGAVPELFVQDEGFSRFGEGARDVARQLIAAIGRRFQTFVYITHELPLAESADMHLRVEAEGGVSRLVS